MSTLHATPSRRRIFAWNLLVIPLVLGLSKPVRAIDFVGQPASNAAIELRAADAKITGPNARLEGADQKAIVWWTNANTSLHWTANVTQPGKYRVVMNYALFSNRNGSPLEIALDDQKLSATPKAGGGSSDYKDGDAGEVTIGKAGNLNVTVKPVQKNREYVIGIRTLALFPADSPIQAVDISGAIKPSADKSFRLTPDDVQIDGMNALLIEKPGEEKQIGEWQDVGTSLLWTVDVPNPGKYRVELNYAQAKSDQGAKLFVSVGDQKLKIQPRAGKSSTDFQTGDAGEITLSRPGKFRVTVTPVSRPHSHIINLRSIALVPAETRSKAIDISDKPIKPVADGSFKLDATEAEIDGEAGRLEGDDKKYLAWWNNADRPIRWPIRIDKSRTFRVELTYAMDSDDHSDVEIDLAGQKLSHASLSGTGLANFTTVSFGEISVEQAGDAEVMLKSSKEVGTLVLRLQSASLIPTQKKE